MSALNYVLSFILVFFHIVMNIVVILAKLTLEEKGCEEKFKKRGEIYKKIRNTWMFCFASV